MSHLAVTHEHFLEFGGGEYVASELARRLDAPIYTGAVADGVVPDDVAPVNSIVKGRIGRRLTRLGPAPRDLYYWLRWPNIDELTEYDVIFQSGNNPGWYVPEDTQTVLRYTHSTPRGPYDLYHSHGYSLFSTIYNNAVRALYQPTIPYPDLYVANSDLVARRIRRYFGVPSEKVRIVYPPVETEQYSADDSSTGDFYFTWSRLYGHKHIDKIVHAFNETGHSLLIGGDGPERDTLERLANDNVELLGWIENDEKRELASGAKAVVFAAENEDFGLVPVEAMAAGTPVIGVRDGFTRYQILDGENGRLFDGTVGSLVEAIRRFERDGVAWDEWAIESFADQFGRDRFEREIREAIQYATERAAIEPKLGGERRVDRPAARA